MEQLILISIAVFFSLVGLLSIGIILFGRTGHYRVNMFTEAPGQELPSLLALQPNEKVIISAYHLSGRCKIFLTDSRLLIYSRTILGGSVYTSDIPVHTISSREIQKNNPWIWLLMVFFFPVNIVIYLLSRGFHLSIGHAGARIVFIAREVNGLSKLNHYLDALLTGRNPNKTHLMPSRLSVDVEPNDSTLMYSGYKKDGNEVPATDTKICPYCAETIKVAARKCRYCFEKLDANHASSKSDSSSVVPGEEEDTLNSVSEDPAPSVSKSYPERSPFSSLNPEDSASSIIESRNKRKFEHNPFRENCIKKTNEELVSLAIHNASKGKSIELQKTVFEILSQRGIDGHDAVQQAIGKNQAELDKIKSDALEQRFNPAATPHA